MGYYRTCPYCGNNLDPGEICDCKKVADQEIKKEYSLSDKCALQRKEQKINIKKENIFI